MKQALVTVAITEVLWCCRSNTGEKMAEHTSSGPITLVIHGGAGTITRANLTPEREKAYT